jgi:hypothetical protein
MKLGLVFLDDDDTMLGFFDEGVIDSFQNINDPSGTYSSLEPNQFAVVSLVKDEGKDMILKYHSSITMVQEQEPIEIIDFLDGISKFEDDEFEEAWSSLYVQLAKSYLPVVVH